MEHTLTFNHVFKDSDDFFASIVGEVTHRMWIPLECIVDLDWDSDIGRNIFFTDCNGNEFSIRLWTIHETDDKIMVDITVFYTLPNGRLEEVEFFTPPI